MTRESTGCRNLFRHADPLFYESGEMTNPQRMMRALEVIQSTGRSIITYRNQQKKQRNFRILEFAIRLPRKELYQRIDHRVDADDECGIIGRSEISSSLSASECIADSWIY